jgi:UrcA family protein
MRVLSLLAASFLTLAIAAPGVAQTPETPSVIVSYGDLDLTSPEGSATLDRRIEAAHRRSQGDDFVGRMQGRQP